MGETAGAADATSADLTTTDLVERFAVVPVANIGDAMERMGVLDSRIRPMWRGARVAGPAFTVWTRSGDNTFIHKALDEAQAGDVIVVNGGGDESRALIGELMAAKARGKGLAGFVIDGAIRDVVAIEELRVPVFARAVTPAGPYKMVQACWGRPIAVGGVVVLAGDLVFGDDDGVIVVPRADAPGILSAAEAIQASEAVRKQT